MKLARDFLAHNAASGAFAHWWWPMSDLYGFRIIVVFSFRYLKKYNLYPKT